MNDAAAEVLRFWFDEVAPEQRFARSDALDADIRARFGDLHARLAAGVPDAWRDDPYRLLAAVIVLDQFSRNLHRDDPRAFACDARALELTRLAIERGYDAPLTMPERQFLYMPFMHSEELADQDRAVALFTAIDNPEALDHAVRHRAVIARFGRFPHRNEALGRETTPEEAEFLTQPGSRF